MGEAYKKGKDLGDKVSKFFVPIGLAVLGGYGAYELVDTIGVERITRFAYEDPTEVDRDFIYFISATGGGSVGSLTGLVSRLAKIPKFVVSQTVAFGYIPCYYLGKKIKGKKEKKLEDKVKEK